MNQANYSTSFLVDQTPEQVFGAVNNPRAWWPGQFEGSMDKRGAEFVYAYPPYHRSTQRVVEFVPGKKVVWRVTDAHLSFVNDKAEWKDTDIVFDIGRRNGKTELRFTHVGLHPGRECYDKCSVSWAGIVNDSLRSLITTGKGRADQAL